MTNALKITRLDYYTVKSQLILAGFTILTMIILLGIMGSSVAILAIYAAWYPALMVGSDIFAVQERNNIDRLYGSVAVGTKDVVLGRYIFALIFYATQFAMVIAVYICIVLFKSGTLVFMDILNGLSLSFFIFSVFMGFQMPLLFKWGFLKARGWVILLFFATVTPFLIVPAVPSLFPYMSVFSDMNEFLVSNQILLVIGGLSLSCVILYLSYRASVVFYRKRKRG